MLPDRQQRLKNAITTALSAPKKSTLLTLKSPIPWGKYKGECVNTILKHDPQYMQWLLNETSIAVDATVRTELHKQLELAR